MMRELFRFLIGLIAIVTILFGVAFLTGCSRDDLTYMKCIVKDNTTYHC